MQNQWPSEIKRVALVAPGLLGWALGTGLQLGQGALWPGWVYMVFMLLALMLIALVAINKIALWLAVGAGTLRWLVALLGGLLLAFGLCGGRAVAFSNTSLDANLEGHDIRVVGIVVAMPQRSEAGLRFRLHVESARLDAGPVAVPPLIDLAWYSGMLAFGAGGSATQLELQRQPGDVRAGERWEMTVRLKAPHGGRNPHGFDFELWLWEQGVQATGSVRAGPKEVAPQRLADTWQHPVERARQTVRDSIYLHVVDRHLAGVIAALVVGDQNAIERADWDLFRATGVAHLMSISGLHVTMFAWLAAACVGWLWRRSDALGWRAGEAWPVPQVALVGGVLLAMVYAVFSGWGVPSQRTIWMLATMGLLRVSGRQWPWSSVCLLACAVVLAIDPYALLQAGFWLSFVAVAVLFATDLGATGEGNISARSRFGLMLREQWTITLALTPLTLLLFQQVSVVGLLANLLAIPWVTLVVTPLCMLGVLVPPLWQAAALAIDALGWLLQMLVRVPFATVSVAAPELWMGATAILGGVLLVLRLPWGWRVMGVPLLLPVLLWQAPRPPTGHFGLLAADIGQGNAVVVRTAAHTLVFDTGPRFGLDSDAGQRVLVPLLRALGETVDTVIVSHRDSDHSGGAASLLATQPQAALLSSIEAGNLLQAVRPVQRCAAGQAWTWDGVRFDVLHPQATDYDSVQKPNALSCVLRVSNGTYTALLVADIEQPQEAALLARQVPLRADVLLVPHHGSKTSSSPAFLDAVQPRFALVQAGYRNRFGHPAPPVLERYQQRGIAVVDSSHCGAASWQSTAPSQMHCDRQDDPRYWQHHPP
ncbi:DNA internalization-related competence protein ComEC/Rec2 [Rhodoferax sp.]|uniref:DNA internalization-related competence protein ComEC/Rec2 n=1 Tax=Rhodoferax sp. TaxID=50421 RepID=UPI0025DF41C2|nr:DNA internalization-related competence protein ComEC/Rec2 [Rhodoferax sp.]